MAEVMQWLALMENETLYGLAKARIICKFKRPGNLEEAQLLGRKGLDVLVASPEPEPVEPLPVVSAPEVSAPMAAPNCGRERCWGLLALPGPRWCWA